MTTTATHLTRDEMIQSYVGRRALAEFLYHLSFNQSPESETLAPLGLHPERPEDDLLDCAIDDTATSMYSALHHKLWPHQGDTDSDDLAHPDRDVAEARAYLLASDLYAHFALRPEFAAERVAQLFEEARQTLGSKEDEL